jgi:hypothetical protein
VASPVNPGKVEWSGENPGIYLKDAEGHWQTLSVFFRVVTSPHGPGIGAVLIGAPTTGRGYPDAPNLCLSNNETLLRWLVDNFVSRFASFRDSAGLRAMTYHPADRFSTTGDGRTFHQEHVAGNGLELTLRWQSLSPPFAVDVAPGMSATGAHQMYSVFVEAADGSITLNGQRMPGKVIQRDFLDRRMSTAFLAFSETWVKPAA